MKAHNECDKAYLEFNKDSDNYEWFELHNMDNFKEHCEMIEKIYSSFKNITKLSGE
jgi:hypothetical protein